METPPTDGSRILYWAVTAAAFALAVTAWWLKANREF